MNYPSIAAQIVAAVGGRENLSHVMHCATRLRLTCLDESKINADAIADIEGVKGVFSAKGQFQIIFGSGTVNQVCDEVLKLTGNQPVVQPPKEAQGNVVNRFIKMLSDIFVPIIPAIVAGGLLMGINNIFTAEGCLSRQALIDSIRSLPTTGAVNLFSMLPSLSAGLIGFSAAKFGGNPYLGAVLGMIMVHPDLMNAYSYGTGAVVPTWNLFGLSIEAVGYQGTVLPVLVMSFFLAKLETQLHKITPSWLDNLTTPLISILVCGFITFLAVGPMLRTAGNLLAFGISWLYHSLGFIGGGLFGLFYAPIVLTGMHHSFIAIETQLLAEAAVTGGSFIFVTASMNNVAQGAAVLAVLATTKDTKLKSLCSASGISALLGITEPAMFGVNLKLKTPFYAAIIGSAVGSAYVAFHHVLAVALGAAGLPGFISIRPADWPHFAIGLALSMITAFVLTWILAKKPQSSQAGKIKAKAELNNIDDQTCVAGLKGQSNPSKNPPTGHSVKN
ncbi:MAG: PTS transporter subunit EIIC [Holdemania massiliensis]